MTSLLTHTVAHTTRPSLWPKTNNQPLKKFLSLVVSWVKVVKNGKILTFKVNFLCQKLSESFYNIFHWRIWFYGHTFCYWHFLKISLFKPIYFLKWRPIFDNFYSTEHKIKNRHCALKERSYYSKQDCCSNIRGTMETHLYSFLADMLFLFQPGGSLQSKALLIIQ